MIPNTILFPFPDMDMLLCCSNPVFILMVSEELHGKLLEFYAFIIKQEGGGKDEGREQEGRSRGEAAGPGR